MAGKLPSETSRETNRIDPRRGSDDTFNDLLEAAVSPLETLEPSIQPDQFVRLPAGAKVSERFVVEWCVGAGGMGDVYRCQDLENQSPAALKVIRRIDDHSRFRREASILSSLSHDAIVRYLAHGTTDTGTPYLAMEWLEGEDLAKMLDRSPLSIADSIALARRVCEGLWLAHRHGFVHRDIKPSNLFVCGGRVADAKLLDFGVAHRGRTTQTSTRAGTMLGTVGYMAPEQAWGMPSPDPRDDLFSLGCVLFECLTGKPAFAGESSVAVLEAVLQVEPPDVRGLAPHIPEPLAVLVRGLLRKARKERPANAEAVTRALEVMGDPGVSRVYEVASVRIAPPSFATLMVVGAPGGKARALDVPSPEDVVRRHGGEPVTAAAWTLAFSWTTSPEVTLVDVAERAFQCASELQRVRPELAIQLSGPTDNVADAASDAIERSLRRAQASAARSSGVSVDSVTAALYRARDDARAPSARTLRLDPETRASTAFVGRDAELAVLTAMLNECANDGVASSTLVLAPSGLGKSRLLAEFVSRIEPNGSFRLLSARGSFADRDTPFALLQRLLPALRVADTVTRDFLVAVEDACAEGTLVVCIDDAQWADVESMRVLAASVTANAERPFLLVGAARSGLSADLLALWHSSGAHEVPLRPFSVRAAERYVSSAFPGLREREPGEAARLIGLAEGNPRLLHALAAASGGGAEKERASAVAIALFAERLAALPSSELAALRAASLFAERFRLSNLRSIVDSNSVVARDVAALCDRKLLVEVPDPKPAAEREFEFAHRIVCEAARRCLSESARFRTQDRARLLGNGTWQVG